MKRVLGIGLLVLIFSNVKAQDIHFSQFYMAPLQINPAAAGAYRGDYRANINFKDQYRSFSNAYRTINGSFDKAITKDKFGRKKLGAGINIYQDIAGDSKTKNFNITLNISQTIRLSDRSDLSLGIGAGFTQYSQNLAGLSWDNQFNGLTYDARLPSRENNLFTNKQFFDFSAGMLYRNFDFEGSPLEIGFSAYHLTTPNIATVAGKDKLPMKFIVYGKKEFDLPIDRWGLMPSLFLAKQAGAFEANIGALARYDAGFHSKYTGYHKKTTFYFGMQYRLQDAIIPQVMLRYQEKYLVGMSYDVNVSRLRAGSKYKGGLEVSLSISGFLNDKFQVASPITF